MTKAFKSTRFASIPYELMDVMTERGGKQIVCVYLWLHRFGWCSDQGCWASLATISESTGIKPDHVRQSIQWLIAEGWVAQTPRPGRTSVYFVRMHRDEVPLPQKGDTPKGVSTPTPKGATNKNPVNKNPVSITQKGASAENKNKDSNTRRKLPASSVPGDLSGCGDLLIEFWSVKKGVRSTPVLNRICKKLRQWSLQDRRTALEAAITSGWGDVFPPKNQAPYSGSQSTVDWDALDNVSFFPNS